MWTRWSGQAAPDVAISWPSRGVHELARRAETVGEQDLGAARWTPRRAAPAAPRARVGDAGLGGRRRRRRRAAEALRPCGAAAVDELGRLVAHRDRPLVGLPGGVAPHDETVLGQHHQAQVGVGADRLADLLGEREARADVRDPGRVSRRSTRRPAPGRRAAQASALIASGWVWWTCAAGMKACRSVSIDERGAAGSSWQRARWATMSSSVISSRASRGSISSSRSGVKSCAAIVARSLPEPLTHIAAHLAADVIGGGALGRGVAAAEVGQGAVGARAGGRRAAPARAWWSAGRVLVRPVDRRRWRRSGRRRSFRDPQARRGRWLAGAAPRRRLARSGDALRVARGAQLPDGVGRGAQLLADLGAQRAHVGVEGIEQQLMAARARLRRVGPRRAPRGR